MDVKMIALTNGCRFPFLSSPQNSRTVGALPFLARPMRGHVSPHVAGTAELGGALGARVRLIPVTPTADKVGVVICRRISKVDI